MPKISKAIRALTHNGGIFRWILEKLGDDMTEQEIDDIITEIDTDGSGTVDYSGEWHNHFKIAVRIHSSETQPARPLGLAARASH